MPKKASKRVPLNRKYTIKKRVKDAERKVKRDAKKNPALRKKLKKDLGIPNLNPFKQQILKRLEEQQKLIKFNELASQRRSQEAARKRKLVGDGDALAGFAADAVARSRAFGEAPSAEVAERVVDSVSRAGEITRRQFYRHLKAMLDKADILLEILDARDPLSCRAPAVEALALAMEPPKRIVLVLNKIDLVPPEVVQAWLAYLRKDFPTIAFKASTQQQRGNLSAPGGAAVNQATEHGEVLTGSGAAGTDTLLQLIKNYSRSHDLKTAVTVGVVGYPNVGKSSVINSLKRSKAVSVSSTPGHTRSLQEVSLDSKVSLIDCPGIIFDDEAPADSAEEGADAGAGLLLRNCIRVEDIEDPETAVDAILKRCNPEKLMALYSIPSYASTGEFLTHMAAKRGKLGKGGVPDKANAARSVLQDWNSGRIPFFVLPPVPVGGSSAAEGVAAMEEEDGAAASHAKTSVGRKVAAAGAGAGSSAMASEEDMDSAAIVSGWSKEFDMEAIIKAEGAVLASLRAAAAAGPSALAGAGAAAAGSGYLSVASSRSAHVKPTSEKAKLAAARLLAEAGSDDEEEDDSDEEEDGEGEGMDEDDDDDEESEEEQEEDEEDSEEELKPAARAAAAKGKPAGKGKPVAAPPARRVRFADDGAGKPKIKPVKGKGKPADHEGDGARIANAGAGGGHKAKAGAAAAGDAYDFGYWFKPK